MQHNPTLATVIAQPLTSSLVLALIMILVSANRLISWMRIPYDRAVTFAGVGFCFGGNEK